MPLPLSSLRRLAPGLVERAANELNPLLKSLLVDSNVQLASDAWWTATHPVDRILGRGRAANGQMVVPWVAGRPWYHGSSRQFQRFNPRLADEDSLYGPGQYVTDSPELASSYTEKGADVGTTFVARRKPLSSRPEWAEFLRMNPDLPPSTLAPLSKGDRLRESVPDSLRAYQRMGYETSKPRRTELITGEKGVEFDYSPRGHAPNVTRYSFTPDRLFDVREGVTARDARRLSHAIRKHPEIPSTRARQALNEVSVSGRISGSKDSLWRALRDSIGPRRANEVLQRAGYDAIAYPGGKMMGGAEHEALVVLNRQRLHRGGRPVKREPKTKPKTVKVALNQQLRSRSAIAGARGGAD